MVPSSCRARSRHDGQAGGLRGDQRALERRAGGAEITQPVTPADELQRVTADIRSTALVGEDVLGEKPGLIEVIGGERHLGVDDAHSGAHATGGAVPARRRAAPRW